MSVSGPSQICESKVGTDTCTKCGRLVCSDHWDPAVQLCVTCAEVAGGRDTPCGFDTDV